MIATDEEALICDLAETYHIYDYKSLPLSRVAIFAVGLKGNSRIKMKMSGLKYPLGTLLLASIVDRLSMLVWQKTKDAVDGRNRPESMLSRLLGTEDNRETEVFSTPEEFERRREEILKGGLPDV